MLTDTPRVLCRNENRMQLDEWGVPDTIPWDEVDCGEWWDKVVAARGIETVAKVLHYCSKPWYGEPNGPLYPELPDGSVDWDHPYAKLYVMWNETLSEMTMGALDFDTMVDLFRRTRDGKEVSFV
eukprot:Rmarinus@m.3792